MLKKEMLEKLNDQVNEELYASYSYLSMSAYFESKNLKGFAAWFLAQSNEERFHAMKLYHYIFERGERVILKPIRQPKTDWDTILSVFEDALKQEQAVTQSINDMTDLAISLKDHATHILLQWFVTEQVEEEASFEELIDRLEMVQDSPPALLMLDSEFGKRQADEEDDE